VAHLGECWGYGSILTHSLRPVQSPWKAQDQEILEKSSWLDQQLSASSEMSICTLFEIVTDCSEFWVPPPTAFPLGIIGD
jgi:hypothetical protein